MSYEPTQYGLNPYESYAIPLIPPPPPKQHTWIRLFIEITIALICLGTGIAASIFCYSNGYTQGHNDGYSQGHTSGYTQGRKDGYGDGYSQGQVSGTNLGYSNGYSIAYGTWYNWVQSE